MRFKVMGANSETGDDIDVVLEAPSQPEVEKMAHEKGILVSSIAPIPVPAHPHAVAAVVSAPAAPANAATHSAPAAHAPPPLPGSQAPGAHPPAAHPQKVKDFSSISLVDDEPAADAADPAAPRHERAHGIITVNANNPGETARSGAGSIDQGKHAETPMEYHVILNQSLFLLEAAVNKQLREGWEPAGGVAVGVSNNALQFFQSLTRKKKPGTPESAPAPATPPAAAPPAPPAASN